MKVLVVGGDSKIGRTLCTKLLTCGHSVVRTSRHDRGALSEMPMRRNEQVEHLDLLDPVLPLPEVRFDVVYLMAAITGVVPAEKHPAAWRVNAEAPVALALEASKRGAHVVFMSSGTVELAPHTASAMQKRYAEVVVHMVGGCVLRPLPVVPQEKYGEIADILVEIGEQQRIGVVRWEG